MGKTTTILRRKSKMSAFLSASAHALWAVVLQVSHRECSAPFSSTCCIRHHRIPHAPPLALSKNLDDSAFNWTEPFNFSATSIDGIYSAGARHARINQAYQSLSLEETFARIRGGASLSRFGDGEIRALLGTRMAYEHTITQTISKAMRFAASLGGAPNEYPSVCIAGVPLLSGNLTAFRPDRRPFWVGFAARYLASWFRIMPQGQYCDAFTSRPDILRADWFPAIEFFTPHWQQVFAHRRVLLVRGATKLDAVTTTDSSVFDRHLALAAFVHRLRVFNVSIRGRVTSMPITPTDMFRHYVPLRDAIIEHFERLRIETVVLSLGPTATVMAAELGCRGYHALDVGQFGGNFTKDRYPASTPPDAAVASNLMRRHSNTSQAVTSDQSDQSKVSPRVIQHATDFWRLSIFRGAVFGFGPNKSMPTWNLPCTPGMSLVQCQQYVGIPERTYDENGKTALRPTVHLGLLPHQPNSRSKWPSCTREISGVTCVADTIHKHSSSKIAHLAKRILPWFSLHILGGEQCDTFALPLTPQHGLTSWMQHMISLTLANLTQRNRNSSQGDDDVDHHVSWPRLLWLEDFHNASRLCFETLKISYTTSTYFRNQVEALRFKQRAWTASGVAFDAEHMESLSWTAHHRIRCCFLWRSNGRNPSNHEALQAEALAEIRRHLHGQVDLAVISPSANMSFTQQVRLFSACDILISPHGSQNANIMFMQVGRIFVELNMPKFYYFAYEELAKMSGLDYVPSRRNLIDWHSPYTSQIIAKMRPYAKLDDVRCQQVSTCRTWSRLTPFNVNLTDLRIELSATLRHVNAAREN